MTCGLAVKRPLDLGTDSSFELDVKRPRHSGANPQCSPFRPQLGILAASLNQSASTPNGIKRPPVDNSPFAEVAGRCQLSSNQLDSYLKAEIQHLKRRKLIPRRPQANGINSLQLENSIANFRKAQSPASSNSGSDSEGESATSHSGVATTGAENKRAPMMEDLYEKPHFSLRQVKLICERLLKEQQIRLRYDYETILNKKLQEQHDQYVQFAKEQLDANAAKMGNDITYVS